MTIKEKWKEALSEYILTGDILVKAREKIFFPYTKLLSVKTKDVIHEKMLCPYCFGITEYKFNESKQYVQTMVKCEHCGHEYERSRYATKADGVLLAVEARSSNTGLMYFDTATIMDCTGIFFILIDNMMYKLDEKDSFKSEG